MAAQEGLLGELALEGGVAFGFVERRGRHAGKWQGEKILAMREARQGGASLSLTGGPKAGKPQESEFASAAFTAEPRAPGAQEAPLEERMSSGAVSVRAGEMHSAEVQRTQ